MTAEKLCRCCMKVLPVGAFNKDRSKRDGLSTLCRECKHSGRNRLPRAEELCRHCGQIKPIAEFEVKTGRLKPGKRCKACVAAYVKAKHAEYKESDPVEFRRRGSERMRRSYLRNPEPMKARAREARKANPKLHSDKCRAWRAANPEKYRAGKSLRRSRELGAPGEFTAADVKLKLKLQGGCCYYCGVSLKDGYHIDHKIPLARGGTNWPANIAPTCQPCNQSKNAKTPAEFRAYLAQTA